MGRKKLQVELRDAEQNVAEVSLRPNACRSYMRRELAKGFDAIVKGFVEEAKNGSCTHVKLAMELLKPERGRRARGGESLEVLMQRLDMERLEQEQAEREREFGVQRVESRQ